LDQPILQTFYYPLSLKNILEVFFENFLPVTVTIDVEVYFILNVALIDYAQLTRNLITDIVFEKHTCLFSNSNEWSLVTFNILARHGILEAAGIFETPRGVR
jgi:hypothetical protein